MKKIIICGASRSGKSFLAKNLQKELSITHINGDSLIYTLQETFPELGITFDRKNYEHSSKQFNKFIKTLLNSQQYHNIDYVLETDHLLPRHIPDIINHIGNATVIFMGYTEIDPQEKFKNIRKFDPTNEDWWTNKQSDEKILKHIHSKISESAEIKKECLEFGIKYFDTGKDFVKTINEAKNFIISQIN